MLHVRDILVPTDFSPHATHAITYAVALAKMYESTLHFVHCVDCSMYAQGTANSKFLSAEDLGTLESSMREHAESQMATFATGFESEGLTFVTHIAIGKPAQEILRAAENLSCDLVVLSTHGRSGLDHMVFGSVCERIVRQSSVPVLSIKRKSHECVDCVTSEIHVRKVLFPYDFSDYSERALPAAVALCRDFQAKLIIVHVNEIPPALPDVMPEVSLQMNAGIDDYARQTMERLKPVLRDVDAELMMLLGAPHREISKLVHEAQIDLVVMATHGRSGVAHMLFGSVAEKVVRTAQCPVLTIRPVEVPSEVEVLSQTG